MKLIRLHKEGESYTLWLPGVQEIYPDGSFLTRAILGGRNSFGRDLSEGIYRWKLLNPNSDAWKIVTPSIPYQVYEQVYEEKECNVIATSYYMGTDYKDVIKYEGGNKFLIEEKIPVEERIPNTNPPEYKKGRYNNVLEYTGLDHLPKPQPKYEGDAYSLIELNMVGVHSFYKLIDNISPKK